MPQQRRVPPFELVNRATISNRDFLSLLLPTQGDRKERQPVDINYIRPHIHITSYLLRTPEEPMAYLAHTIPYPVSDCSYTASVPVTPQNISAPVTSRFSPTLGWLHFVRSLTRRTAESVALSVPDSSADLCGAGPRTICWCKRLESVVLFFI